MQAHRFIYELTYGKIIGDLVVCHHCDNPTCVRIDHLFLGTQQENIDDKVSKNRQAKGIAHGSAKLTDKEVKEIRELFASGNYTEEQLSNLYKVHNRTICCLIQRITWKHIV